MAAPSSDPTGGIELARSWLPAPYRQELAYRVAGSGRPIVLLHGFVNSSTLWKDTQSAFQPDYRLYALDLPGHGQSPPRLPWKLREVAEITAAWMRSLALDQATIIGHSMGGALGMLIAATQPELVSRLILINTIGLPMQQSWLHTVTRAGLSLSTRQHARYTASYSNPRSHQALALWQAASDVLTCDLRPDLAAIRCPTSLIWGLRDPLLPLQSAIRLQQAIRGAELICLPTLRHQPHRQNPTIFQAILRDLLARDENAPDMEKASLGPPNTPD